MGFYDDRILPHLIDLSMRNRRVAERRQGIVPNARGRVLEIGIGSGLNLPFYDPGVEAVVGVDPSAKLLAMARRAAERVAPAVELVEHSAEALPFDTASFDTVVSTWTLCSIPDVNAALTEIRRVLKPAGSFLFIEHGAAAEPAVARWQDRLNPVWGRFSGGCHLNRPIDALVRQAGLAIAELETGYLLKGPRLLAYHYDGRATAG
ncbi:MAG: class I SAM-dependent methyltransferase [Inquilinus sp.]|nr:class I SAM-dependent methyltransferase [Inquilinus sp.]